MDVVGRRLPAHEDDRLARLSALLGDVRVEDDRARRRPRRRVQAARDDVDLRGRVDHRVQELVELGGIDPHDRLLARDQPLVDHLGGDPERRGCRPFPGARLEEVQRPLLHRELDVLHVAVVRLEQLERPDQLVVGRGHELAHAVHRLRRADPGDDVLALRVREELAVEAPLPRRRIAREADTGARAFAAVAEHHLHDVDRRPEVVRDVVRPAVHLRARRLPRVEDRAVRPLELVGGALRELGARPLPVDRLEALNELAKVVGREVDVLLDSSLPLEIRQRLLEAVAVDAVDDLAVHLHEPAVRVEREAGVAGRRSQAFDGRVPEAEVQDRVHHPRHRDRGARADRDEERVRLVAEALPGSALEGGDMLSDLVVETVGDLASAAHVGTAGVGRDREPVRDRDTELGHLGEPDSLASQQLAAAGRVFLEVVDVAHLRGESTDAARCAGTRMAIWSSIPSNVAGSQPGVTRVTRDVVREEHHRPGAKRAALTSFGWATTSEGDVQRAARRA